MPAPKKPLLKVASRRVVPALQPVPTRGWWLLAASLLGLMLSSPARAGNDLRAEAGAGAGKSADGTQQAGAPSEDAQADTAERLRAAASLARRTARLQEFINDVPRISFDPAAVVAAVGKDPESLLSWVAETTRWVPYSGLLRGARGVLMDGRGNGLDRALLLLELLNEAGHAPRLHRGQLTPDQADALSQALIAQAIEPSTLGGATTPTPERIAVAADRMGIPVSQLNTEILAMQSQAQTAAERGIARMLDQSARLAGFLDGEGAARFRASERSESARCLQDHWWITLESGQRLDPLLASVGDSIKALEETTGSLLPESTASFAATELESLPEDLFHTLTVAFEIEVTDGKKQDRKTVLTHTVRVHEFVGESLLLSCSPLDYRPLSPEVSAKLGATERILAAENAVLECREWLPAMLIRGSSIEQNSFRADGSLNAKPVRGTARLVEKASGALAGLGTTAGNKSSETTALFATYRARWPSTRGPEEERHERIVFDALGGEARRAARTDGTPFGPLDRAGQLERALVIGYLADVAPLMCTPSEAYVHGLCYATTLENRDALVTMALAQAETDPDSAHSRSESAVSKLRSRPVAQWTWGQLRPLYAGADPRIFVDRPNVISRFQLLGNSEESNERWRATSGYDVIMNHVGVSFSAAEDPAEAARLRLRQGVADTVLEATLLKRSLADAPFNVSESFALAGGETWVRAQVAPPFATGDVLADYGSGRAVAPAVSDGEEPRLEGYWRIDATTGETLGVGPEGRGQVSVETQIMIMFAITVGLTYSCARHDSGPEQDACLAKALCFMLGTAVAGVSMTPFLGGITIAACLQFT